MARVNPAQLQKFLGGVDYPCSRDELASHASSHGADENIVQAIHGLPRDEFSSPSDVSQAMAEQ